MESTDTNESDGEEDGHRLRTMLVAFSLVVSLPLLAATASATELGVNYYHETLWSDVWQKAHIEVSEPQARNDFREIKQIADHVKLYFNPFVSKNVDWIETLVPIAREEGLTIALNAMVDDRQLHDGNWNEYRNGVLRACAQFNGKADTLMVANEVLLQSSWSSWDIRSRVEPLIRECDALFSGEVTYSAFWYEKDAWTSYTGPIHFNMYEDIARFTTNVQEMDARFGPNARIGEWGVDLYNGGSIQDGNWQKDQIAQRWDVISHTRAPVAYLFAYREPSDHGFGIITPSGQKLPLWDLFGGTPSPSEPAQEPATPSSPHEPAAAQEISALRVESAPGSSKVKDVVSGQCRTVAFDTPQGYGEVLLCDKGSSYEGYWRSGSEQVSVCVEGRCLSRLAGFVSVSKEGSAVEQPVKSVPSEPVSGSSGSLTVTSLSVSSSPGGSKVKDEASGTCRTVAFDTPQGYGEVLLCDKGSSYEGYWRSGSEQVSVCVEGRCLSRLAGFVSVSKEGSAVEQPVKSVPSEPVSGSSGSLTVTSLSVSSSPGGSKVKDEASGTCRTVAFDTSAGYAEAQVCDKGSSFEAYWKGGSNQANVCFEGACVTQLAGFARIGK